MKFKLRDDAEPTASSDFYYEVMQGYIDPRKYLVEEQAEEVLDALHLIDSYLDFLVDQGMLEEM